MRPAGGPSHTLEPWSHRGCRRRWSPSPVVFFSAALQRHSTKSTQEVRDDTTSSHGEPCRALSPGQCVPLPACSDPPFEHLDNIIASSKSLAYDLMKFYHGNESGQIPGLLPGPPASGTGDYYWWEAGAMMGTYIDYWKLTGDATYNDVVTQGMLFQVGPQRDYMPPNQTLSLGNDDQGFWGLSALLAAENKFPDPPPDQPQWLELAQAVWNTQADPSRYDETCNGGLRWQIPRTNAGYDYKNTIANGIFFNMGARLARYTGNDTYADRAEKAWDWLWGVKYIDHDNWAVYDGASVNDNCTDIHKTQYSYNAGVLIQGVAFMYNHVRSRRTKPPLGAGEIPRAYT
ncbi:hypothetical protein J3459_016681 [Metarhizium acridum]|nr:hypothetical protein J3459_016681 [Metarhizium acridum]